MKSGLLRAFLLPVAWLLCPAAWAQDPRPWQVEAGVGAERFSSTAPSWRQEDLALRWRFAPRALAEINARHTRRNGRDDHEIGAALALPLDERWAVNASATASPSHRVLARQSGTLGLARNLDGGWVLGASLGRSLFGGNGGSTTGSSILRLNGERYVGAWRLALGLARSRLDGGQTENGWVAQIDHYVGERGRLGFVVARGRELENVPELDGVLSTQVDTLALVAAWPLAADWTLNGALTSADNRDGLLRSGPRAGQAVGSGYRRNGIRIGVQHDF